MNYFLHVLRNYAVFQGRARRKEYWMFVLFNIIFAVAILMVDGAIMATGLLSFSPLYILYTLAIIVPSLSVVVRRLHDQNKTGWWFLIGFVPVVGGIWLLVLLCTEGTAGPNQYGPDPKAEPALAY
ncbi:DUF805 domain-containing protein [Hymenobacter sediminis]|uniref:DUF805 domain-containing protein n=1 Tax=Hymenobacter sediminis TaxID=2218621 RepID=UPI000DA6750A|nr:DUF805 domain-containing protein [Hymenobacter sediminis]RPD49638.1 DUF805 domain-containing protein [Hymenobacter sediminis]